MQDIPTKGSISSRIYRSAPFSMTLHDP